MSCCYGTVNQNIFRALAAWQVSPVILAMVLKSLVNQAWELFCNSQEMVWLKNQVIPYCAKSACGNTS
ncbi:hypothetical protein [uncultured Nostoc sp.]|uniref:hypothetical protein n=1 Tax=uncultured Nostoc sp. TaxID=340711 RepID=UPI002606EAF1|nr:hypothetical protein [uncultured Nostoc sp.]